MCLSLHVKTPPPPKNAIASLAGIKICTNLNGNHHLFFFLEKVHDQLF